MSMDAFRGPVDAMNFRTGSRPMISAVSGVRSRITQITSKGASRATSASTSEM
jgi:hypothetical protein